MLVDLQSCVYGVMEQLLEVYEQNNHSKGGEKN